MVGLSIVLEAERGTTRSSSGSSSSSSSNSTKKTPQVVNKLTMSKTSSSPCTKPSPSPPPTLSITNSFLDRCFLCKQKLLPLKDIYMYKGDRAFCSVECRCRQIFMDEEQNMSSSGVKRSDNCSLAAMRPRPTPSSSPSSRNRRSVRNPHNGFTAF